MKRSLGPIIWPGVELKLKAAVSSGHPRTKNRPELADFRPALASERRSGGDARGIQGIREEF
jgi:hypothetical protein